ncbi:unnamed protein product, partial [Mesorhabditis belari]|uniref:Palmitoyltransferase n=1 Tax=Mesorhabditis belari TaxID=2138241 RepID=A0AAF3FG33_9BILA
MIEENLKRRTIEMEKLIGENGNDIDRLDPVPPIRRMPDVWFPRWLAELINLFVVVLVLTVFELAIYLYIPAVYTSDLIYYLARFIEAQILLNMFAIRWSAHKDNPFYQMNRLGISSKRLEILASQNYTDKHGNEHQAHKWCPKCERTVPIRTVHCGFCGTCSLRNDHHCFVVNTCLGVATLRYFYMMGLWFMIVGIWGMYCFCESRRDKGDDDGTWSIYLLSFGQVVIDVLGVHALGLNMFRWYSQGYTPTFANSLPWACYLLCAIAFIAGLSITCMETMFLKNGFAMMEFFLSKNKPIQGDRGTFKSRVRFVHGRLFYLNALFPRFWEDVEWTPEFVRSVITHPYKIVENV